MAWLKDNVALIGVVVPIVALALTGAGFLFRRFVTGQKHKEHTDSIEDAVRLKKLLDDAGMTFEQACVLRDQFRTHRGVLREAEARAIVDREARESKELVNGVTSTSVVPFEETTIGMMGKLQAEIDTLTSEMNVALASLEHLCSEARTHALSASQAAWETFCAREAEFAALLFEGGSAAPLLAGARKVHLIEQRIADLRLSKAEEESFTRD